MIRNTSPEQKNTTSKAFTIVELLIVIVVIAILAGITIIGYGSWRDGITESRVKSDAANVYSAMQNARNFSKTGYPVLAPGTTFDGSSATASIFKSSQDVTATYVEGTKAYFCINITSTTHASVKYFIDSRLGSEPKEGDCVGGEYDSSVVGVGQPIVYREMSVGAGSVCGMGLDNKAYCAGRFIGDGTSVFTAFASSKLAGTNGLIDGSSITKVVSGNSQNCGIAAARAYCWGNLITGDGTSANRVSPLKISGNGALLDTMQVTDISAATSVNGSYACAIGDARLFCWGDNNYGVLGNGTTTEALSPTAVLTNGVMQNVPIAKVMTGHYRVAAISDTGRLFIWGYALPGNTTSSSPTEPAAFVGKNVTKVAMGNYTTYVLTANGELYGWGTRSYGQMGDGTTGTGILSTPTLIQQTLAGKTITDLAATASAACALTEGSVYCWGRNHEGQLGIGSTTDTNVPTLVQGALTGKQVRKITSTSYDTNGQKYCATTTENKVYCWGSAIAYNGTTLVPASQTPLEVTTLGTFL